MADPTSVTSERAAGKSSCEQPAARPSNCRTLDGPQPVDFRAWLQQQGPGELTGPQVRAAGRVVLQRDAGKLRFVDIQDWTGKIQLFIGKQQVGEEGFALAGNFDLGDLVGVDGQLRRTKTGELTIFAEKLHFLCKALDPPPEKHHGLQDPELRQRMRYLDLTYSEGVLPRFLNRTKIVHSIRQTLAREGFCEIEGPTLHTIAGGAAARPFITHHNTLDIRLFLRIALELHLKRLLVGGMERVYELGRVYRNEGISQKHNPEFTMLEVYQAYGNYETMMDLTEKIIVGAIAGDWGTVSAAVGRSGNRFHAALCTQDVQRVVPRAHGRGAGRCGGGRRVGQVAGLGDRQSASRRDQERGLRGQGRGCAASAPCS